MAKAKQDSDEPAISKLSSKADESFIATGIAEIDELIGGIPRGRILELWGQEGVGKTYTVSRILASASKDHKILFIDSEFALNRQRVEALGADTKNIDFIQDARLERVAELMIDSVGKYDLIILDSLAQLTPTTVADATVGENAIGLFARQVKHFVVKFRPRLGASQTACIVINQYRKPFGLYARAEPPGGASYHHAVDVRLHLTRNSADLITKAGVTSGHWLHVEVKKSKVSPPYLTSKYKVEY